jgi:hypothetical protein
MVRRLAAGWIRTFGTADCRVESGRRFVHDSSLEGVGFEPSVPVRRLEAKLARKQLRNGPVSNRLRVPTTMNL